MKPVSKTNASTDKPFSLKGHLLIAMPEMGDARFERSVILICSHNEEGCLGYVLNQPVISPLFDEVLAEVELDEERTLYLERDRQVPIFRGGPVEKGRGFVLHSLDFGGSSTVKVTDSVGLTATLDVLKAIATRDTPNQFRMLLGYAGWSDGQLEQEIAENAWLTVPASDRLVFDIDTALMYDAALAELGVSAATLSGIAGHA